MKEYPKINTIWKRNKDGTIMTDELSDQELDCVRDWRVTEKIDGMNIRVEYKVMTRKPPPNYALTSAINFAGRTDAAVIPEFLMTILHNTFTFVQLDTVFDYLGPGESVILFGEGYGPKIQNGGSYSDKNGFVLFDVWFDSNREIYPAGLWASREAVKRIAASLGIEVVGEYGVSKIDDIIHIVRDDVVVSILALEHDKMRLIEGVVVRPPMVLLKQNGDPLIWKLKRRDFEVDKTKETK